MRSVHGFPSKQVELQQAFFQKSIQSDESHRHRKKQAQSDFDQQREQSINVLDFTLRQTALTSLFNARSSTDLLIDTLAKTAQRLANNLREAANKLYKEKLGNADTCKRSIELNSKEQDLMSQWGEIDVNRLKISIPRVENRNRPRTLEAYAAQATESCNEIKRLGEPYKYGSGRLGRNGVEIVGDIINGMGGIITFIFELLFADGAKEGFSRLFIGTVIILVIAAGISDASEIPFWGIISIFVGLILSFGGVIGGLGLLTLDEKRKRRKKVKEEKREKLIAGLSAYSTYIRAKNLTQGLYEERVRQLEDERNNELENATKQEQQMMLNINRFKAELEQTGRLFRLKLQEIETDYQRERQDLKQEYDKIRKELTGYSKLAISEWNDIFWQQGVSDALAQNRSEFHRGVGEIRIGSTVYPGGDQPRVRLPMLIDLEKCGHIFIFSTPDTDKQATDLLKGIVARFVFAMPLFSAKFIFIDTEAAAAFADYQKIPEKIRGRDIYSLEDEIQKETRSLEQHQKRMQAKVGNGDLQTYNSTAEEREMLRILCVSGFPNPNRFRIEAESHLENIIRSGAKVGIHVVLKINTESSYANRDFRSIQELYSKYGVILQPLGSSGKWEVCFKEKTIPFIADTPPDVILMDPIMQQIRANYEEKPVGHPLRVFICYALEDKALVREIHAKLKAEKWINPWLNEEALVPGQDWALQIEKAVRNSDVVVACISNNSVTKEGHVQKELRIAHSVALEKPEGMIFMIPLRLEDCPAPFRLDELQRVDYFPPEQREDAFQQLLRALKVRYEQRSSK